MIFAHRHAEGQGSPSDSISPPIRADYGAKGEPSTSLVWFSFSGTGHPPRIFDIGIARIMEIRTIHGVGRLSHLRRVAAH